MEQVHALVEHAVGFAWVHFVRADLIGDVIDDVADIHGIQNPEEEVEIHFQPSLGFRLVQASALLKEQHSEPVETGIPQGQPVLGLIHPEAAGPAGARREKDIAVDNFLLAHALLFHALDVFDKIANGEVSWVTLAVVAVLLAKLERLLVGNGHSLAFVTQAFQSPVNKLFVLPGETTEKYRGPVTLGFRKGVLDGPVKLLGLALLKTCFLFQSPALILQALADQFVFRGNLNQPPTDRRNFIERTSAHSSPRFQNSSQGLAARRNVSWSRWTHSPSKRALIRHRHPYLPIDFRPALHCGGAHPRLTRDILSRPRVKVNGLALNGYFLDFNWMLLKLSSHYLNFKLLGGLAMARAPNHLDISMTSDGVEGESVMFVREVTAWRNQDL